MEEEDATLDRLVRDGYQVSEIAELLQLTVLNFTQRGGGSGWLRPLAHAWKNFWKGSERNVMECTCHAGMTGLSPSRCRCKNCLRQKASPSEGEADDGITKRLEKVYGGSR